MLAIDGLASWGLMLLFIREPSAIIYAIFPLVVIEGAVRFGLTGSLLTGAFLMLTDFVLGKVFAALIK